MMGTSPSSGSMMGTSPSGSSGMMYGTTLPEQ
jgi:hypothetical protein